MAYIDKQYYDNEYKGVPISDEDTFSRLAERASDIIDQMTGYLLHGQEFTQFAQFIQTQVKKAVAAQIEYMASFGGELASHGGGGFSSVNIGNFSYSEGEGTKNLSRNEQRTSPAVIEYLRPTGLLYRGVNVHG
jgi:hypothetical protein